MTVQEAIESVEYLKEQLQDGDDMICFTGDEVNALNIAIECMEKQIPKKPNFVKKEYFKFYKCPSCGSVTLRLFCGECGQKLDWKEGGTSE